MSGLIPQPVGDLLGLEDALKNAAGEVYIPWAGLNTPQAFVDCIRELSIDLGVAHESEYILSEKLSLTEQRLEICAKKYAEEKKRREAREVAENVYYEEFKRKDAKIAELEGRIKALEGNRQEPDLGFI